MRFKVHTLNPFEQSGLAARMTESHAFLAIGANHPDLKISAILLALHADRD